MLGSLLLSRMLVLMVMLLREVSHFWKTQTKIQLKVSMATIHQEIESCLA